MRVNVKKQALILLAGATALTLGGACLCMKAPVAYAAENAPCAFYNVGADTDAALIDTALGLAEGGVSATTAGTVTEGSTLFTSYAENAAYTVALSGATTYRVAVAVKSGATVKIGNETVTPTGTGENLIATKEVTGSSTTVEVTGKVCAILADDKAGDATLMAVDYTAGQVIPYGALLSDVLENATGYYSDGTSKELKINYGDINAGAGVNVNFTTIDVEGTVEGTDLTVSRYLTTMPDKLIYFINGGSHDYDNGRWEKSSDPFYEYNQTIFDYYKNGSGTLKNDGTPDRKAPNNNEWGWYGNTESAVTHTASAISFPYSSVRCMDRDGNATLGYYLTGLDSSKQYRVWMGTLSPWHARTVDIRFNGKVVGADTLRINSSKGFTVFEGVTPDGNGKVDINLKGGSTNEPCFSFIAVQEMSTTVDAIPAQLQANPTVDTEDTSVTLEGVKAGAKLQIYNAAKPYQVIYEEMADPEKITEKGYVLDWGEKLEGIAQFNVVQITNGGASNPLLISITDIKFDPDSDNKLAWIDLEEGQFTTKPVTIKVVAQASSGIVRWSWRLGEYGEETVYNLDRPLDLNTSFTVTANGDYYVVVTSGLGVTYTEYVKVNVIELTDPVITLTPSHLGWKDGHYNVSLTVTSVAPIVEYKLLKNGTAVTTAATAPEAIEFAEKGEYTIYVKTKSGRTAMSTLQVSDNPTVTKVKASYVNRTLTYTFGATSDYQVDSVTVYLLNTNDVSRMTILSGNQLSFSKAGTYVAIVTTTTGAVEVFSFSVAQGDLRAPLAVKGSSSNGLGIGIGVGVGGIVAAAVAVVLTVVLLKKKQPAKAAVAEKVVEAPSKDAEKSVEAEEEKKTEESVEATEETKTEESVETEPTEAEESAEVAPTEAEESASADSDDEE